VIRGSLKGLLLIITLAVALGSEAWPQTLPPPAQVGFSFSPVTSQLANRDPVHDLSVLLSATNPDVVRLPVYWEYVEPTLGAYDFSSVDSLLGAVAAHNAVSGWPTRVVLTVGARNFLYPELHEPAWAGPREQPYITLAQSGQAYRDYFASSIARYRDSQLLYAWQVENEPLDVVGNPLTGVDDIDPGQLAWEIGEVHRLDPMHKVLTTTYDGWNVAVDMLQVYATPLLQLMRGYPSGHPEDTLEAGDALGLDLYLEGPSIPLNFTSVDLRAEWKRQALSFWSSQATATGKELWLAEMQAQPWGDSTSFTPSDLVDSAEDYRQERLQVVLMWGVDTWLADPAWLNAGIRAMNILRAGQGLAG
jgi:hypothetical protein